MAISFYERLISFKKPDESTVEFAGRLGVSASTLKRWAEGGRPEQAERYIALSEVLKCRVSWLAFGNETQKSTRVDKN
ncbi:MAG: helix-turn-helix domain-containing protein [Patescibacteria group bacterium]